MIQLLATDTKFHDSPDAGEPDCLCSRCGQVIPEREIPIRAWPDDIGTNPESNYEYRYHPACVGMKAAEPYEQEDFYDPYDNPRW